MNLGKMVDCKCCKNLFGFAASRPPCFVFTVCLAAFAIGLFSLGYFVQVYGWFNDAVDIQYKEWHSLLDHLGSSEFCIFGNQSFLQNSTIANTTNITGPTPAGFAAVIIPQIDLSIIPSDDFRGLVNNVTHVTAKMTAKELGLSGSWSSNFDVNVTLTLSKPWAMDCQENKCRSVYIETCGSVVVPTNIIPQHLLSRSPSSCNMSSDFNILEMNSIEKHATAINQMDKQCINGIKAETTVPLKEPHNPTGTMSLVDASAVNLRLQYSSYFLFVMVITCVLYGMIKGRPGKQTFIKKSNLPL